MKKLFLLFFLVSCTTPNSNFTTNNGRVNFSDSLTFDEFEELLIKYSEISPYPNISK